MQTKNEHDSLTSNKSRAPAWRRRKPHREQEILQAARGVLEESGYEGAAMIEIARRAGVSEATLYNYFDSKHDLMHRVIGAWMKPSLEALEREIWLIDGVAGRLRLLATRHLREIAATPRLHRVIYSELRWTDYAGSPMHRMNQRYARIVVRILQDGMRDGELNAGIDLRVARDLFFGGMEHTGWRVLLLDHEVDMETAANTLVDQFLAGLGVKPAGATVAATEARLSRLVDRMEDAVAAMEAAAPPSGQAR